MGVERSNCMCIAPVRFEPLFKQRIWGGTRLRDAFGKQLPAGEPVGESWELAELAEGQSVVAGGPLDGLTIRQLLNRHGREFGFTELQCEPPFGLLVKLLDANDVLSVQVHPDGKAAKQWPGEAAKTECWYVIEAEPGSVIYCGVRPGVDRADLQDALGTGDVESRLVCHLVSEGDFFFVPAGTAHALGAGVLVAEIQTPSDTTFRLFDWNRVDASGRARELHVDEALTSIHFGEKYLPGPFLAEAETGGATPLPNLATAVGSAKLLVDCPYFSVAFAAADRACTLACENATPLVLIALSGHGSVSAASTDVACPYRAGDTLLIPSGECTLDIAEAGEFLIARLGDSQEVC